MGYRELRLKLPSDLPNDRYAALTHAVFALFGVAGVAHASSILVDADVTDSELNEAFDRHSAQYPWGREVLEGLPLQYLYLDILVTEVLYACYKLIVRS
ncbi:hypothetical protein [Saccharothrix sp.]|uniref:hypothetical protein n=1 Tax=Saccharothrix sp. TaxID=1873460 RepID=UPI002812465C|nr:hypothetical protein [Saccharothrix sp.]